MYDLVSRLLKRFLNAREQARRFHPEAIGKGVDPSRCLGDYLTSLVGVSQRKVAAIKRVEEVYRAERVKAALSVEQGGLTGGYLVPPELRYDLMEDVAELSIFRPRCLVVEMTSNTLDLPLPDAETAQDDGVSPFFGGLLMEWWTEGRTRPETEQKYRSVELNAWELTGYALASRPLMDDGGKPLEGWLRQLFARSIAWYEDFAFVTGTGVGQPLGVLNSNGKVLVNRGTSSHFVAVDVGKMEAALLPSSWDTALWLFNPTVWADAVGLGTGGASWQMNQPSAGPGQPKAVLNGQGVFTTEKTPTLGTAGDVALVDPRLYVIGDRLALQIDVSNDEPTAFLRNRVAWRIVQRIDGRPWFDQKITLQDGSTEVSPIVVLN